MPDKLFLLFILLGLNFIHGVLPIKAYRLISTHEEFIDESKRFLPALNWFRGFRPSTSRNRYLPANIMKLEKNENSEHTTSKPITDETVSKYERLDRSIPMQEKHVINRDEDNIREMLFDKNRRVYPVTVLKNPAMRFKIFPLVFG